MIDLKQLAGDRYRLTLDESAKQDTSRASRPWYYRIPGKYGFISLHGEPLLAAYARGSRIAARLAAIPGVRVHQRGDGEIRVVFPPHLLDEVAGILKSRRRRRLSPEVKAAAVARLAASRFRPTVERS